MKRDWAESTLPFYEGSSFRAAAATAAKARGWRSFERAALRKIADGDFQFEKGDVSTAWHVCTELSGQKLVFMFVRGSSGGRQGYHIVYESWHMQG